MLVKDPVEVEKIFLAELQTMPDEAVKNQAKMFGIPVQSNVSNNTAKEVPPNLLDDK